jgi:hypothetical protein
VKRLKSKYNSGKAENQKGFLDLFGRLFKGKER